MAFRLDSFALILYSLFKHWLFLLFYYRNALCVRDDTFDLFAFFVFCAFVLGIRFSDLDLAFELARRGCLGHNLTYLVDLGSYEPISTHAELFQHGLSSEDG